MRYPIIFLFALLAPICLSIPVHNHHNHVSSATTADLPRLVIYFQTTHDSNGNPISMLPLITQQNISLTHLIVCSFHINAGSVIHLNDFPPSDTRFNTLWAETQVLRNASVKIMGMIGGAASGSFDTSSLDGNATVFSKYYGQLYDTILTYGLQGMDLDVEQKMSQKGITRLINQLYADFGSDFFITLAPVGTALRNGDNLSGFDYDDLDAAVGSKIAFYNGQFYNGFGDMSSTESYDAVIANGWTPSKILAGQVTSPSEGGGFVTEPVLNSTVVKLRSKYGQIGGIMGWEYFDSAPGGTSRPWEWAQEITAILRPTASQQVNLTITNEIAIMLVTKWRSSVITKDNGKVAAESGMGSLSVDYHAMVNA
ncbi:glycoside hydrolase family 18 protein [Stipitochalara longipes BDJ]|nr:glycoside hydrolase family 18 protein [Stipitochalara longipes BDJ]